MPNDQEIMIYSDIEPFEYKPRLYYATSLCLQC